MLWTLFLLETNIDDVGGKRKEESGVKTTSKVRLTPMETTTSITMISDTVNLKGMRNSIVGLFFKIYMCKNERTQ